MERLGIVFLRWRVQASDNVWDRVPSLARQASITSGIVFLRCALGFHNVWGSCSFAGTSGFRERLGIVFLRWRVRLP